MMRRAKIVLSAVASVLLFCTPAAAAPGGMHFKSAYIEDVMVAAGDACDFPLHVVVNGWANVTVVGDTHVSVSYHFSDQETNDYTGYTLSGVASYTDVYMPNAGRQITGGVTFRYRESAGAWLWLEAGRILVDLDAQTVTYTPHIMTPIEAEAMAQLICPLLRGNPA